MTSKDLCIGNFKNMLKTNTNSFAKSVALEELKKRGLVAMKSGRGFEVNQKRINIRGCNIDNGWAQKTGPGWNRLDPKKFNYFICVAFDENHNNIRYFIFSKEDVEKFPNVVWKNAPNLKNIILKQDDKELDQIIKDSENKWDKII